MKLPEWIVLTWLAFLVQGCGEWPPPYESQFPDEVYIDFHPGHPFDAAEPMQVRIEAMLREKKIGFWSGVMGIGNPSDIEGVYLGMNFELVDEVEFMQSLIDEGILPEGVKFRFLEGVHKLDDDLE